MCKERAATTTGCQAPPPALATPSLPCGHDFGLRALTSPHRRRPRWTTATTILLAAIGVAVAASAMAEPSRAWARCSGGEGISADGQIGGCTSVIQSGRENPPNLAKAFSQRGTAFFGKGDYRRAIQDYSQVINLEPNNPTAFDNRCWTRATLGLLQEALEDCDQSLRLRPNFQATLSSRGFVYLKFGALDAAIADFDASLASNPRNPYALYARGAAKLKKGDASGNDDIVAAKAVKAGIAEEFERYGLK
jgi:tetratricopeptide (TPR) repeat protein